MSNLVPVNNNIQPLPPDEDAFYTVCDAVLLTVAQSSKPIYSGTFMQWADWCEAWDIDYLDLTPVTVSEFILTINGTKRTRQRHLSALRQLAKMLAVLDYTNPARAAAYEALKMIRAPHQGTREAERQHSALTPDVVIAILESWPGDDDFAVRNTALLNVMFGTGLRRAEVVALKWSNIDFNTGVVHVAHGKGDITRDVAIMGSRCIPALQAWRRYIPGAVCVFPQLNADGVGLSNDTPISTQRVYEIVLATSERTGIEFRPHDCRRAFITEQLANGGILHDVQAQAGHKNPDMTLHYAQSSEANKRGKRLSVRW